MAKWTVLALATGITFATAIGHAQRPNQRAEIHNPAKFDSGEVELDSSPGQEVAAEHRPLLDLPRQSVSNNRPDGALQVGSGPLVNTTDGLSFDGVAANGSAPPDTNMAVGPNHIHQTVNSRYAIYTKSGTLVAGPNSLSSLWAPLGSANGCATNNAGDVVAQYDKLADRFLVT